MFGNLWGQLRGLFSPSVNEAEVRQQLDRVRDQAPVPVFWLLGKTQSGKTSVIRHLTGADRAEIGRGFQPCTRFSSSYNFPTDQAPLMSFLDTRGLDEPGYDAAADLAQFNHEAHLVLVTAKALDHAQLNVLDALRRARGAASRRPVVLILTCLHEGYPQQQHPLPYPFTADADAPPGAFPQPLLDSLAEHKRRFAGLYDRAVAVDLTPADEGFNDPNYGGAALRDTILELLPAAQSQTLRALDVAQRGLQDLFAQRAMPTILGYATLAATAGAVPVPFVDLVLISATQTKMLYELANLYGQPLTKQRMGELAGALGLGLLGRQAGRALIKVIPGLGTILGSVAGGALAGASTYALGKAFCYYYRAVLEGHAPDPADLRRYYQAELQQAEQAWQKMHPTR